MLSFATLATLLTLPLTGIAAPTSISPRALNYTSAGALYFTYLRKSGNFIVANDILQDGTVKFNKLVPTGGSGVEGKPIVPMFHGVADRIFSAHSVIVVGNQLLTTNTDSDSVSVFNIDANKPTDITLATKPAHSVGEFPVALAANPKDPSLIAVLTIGAKNGLALFRLGKNNFTYIPESFRPLGVNQTTPPVGPFNTGSDVQFSEDGKSVYVSVKAPSPMATPLGYIAQLPVDLKAGQLGHGWWKRSAIAGGNPFGMAKVPGKNVFVVTDVSIGASTWDMDAAYDPYYKGAIPKNYTYPLVIPKQGDVCWVEYSKQTDTYFATDPVTNTISEISLDKNYVPTLVKQHLNEGGQGHTDNAIATINGNDFIYTLGANTSVINVMKNGNAPGSASVLQVFDFSSIVANLTGDKLVFDYALGKSLGVPFVPQESQISAGLAYFLQ